MLDSLGEGDVDDGPVLVCRKFPTAAVITSGSID